MDNRLSLEDISGAIDELVGFLGMREAPSQHDLLRLAARKPRRCVQAIAAHLGLPIKINLSHVPATYTPHGGSRFESRHLAPTDSREGGTQGISAQVLIPGDLPFYGVSALKDFPIEVRISEDCTHHTGTFIAVIAHEMSHVLLHSLRHSEKDNEFYTELTAMVLGFSAIIGTGRHVTTQTTTWETSTTRTMDFGYLTDDQFSFARRKIEGMLSERRRFRDDLLDAAEQLEADCSHARRALLRFRRLMECMDEKRPRVMSKSHAFRIGSFHQAGYTYELEAAIREAEEVAVKALRDCDGLDHYTRRTLKRLEEGSAATKRAVAELSPRLASLEEDSKVLQRHVGLVTRLRIAMEVRKAAAAG